MLSRYIWQGKKTRIRFQTLQLTKDKGGLALLCLKDYYIYRPNWRFRIVGALTITGRDGKKSKRRCRDLFQFLLHKGIKDLLSKYYYSMETGNKWINLSLKMWLNVINNYGLLEEIKILNDTDFMPNHISSYCTVFNQGTLSDFQALKRLHGLNNSDFFRFFRYGTILTASCCRVKQHLKIAYWSFVLVLTKQIEGLKLFQDYIGLFKRLS